jgi:hypothetical protein
MRHRGQLRRIQQLGVFDAVIALVGRGVWRLPELDYSIGHGGANCSTADVRVAALT